MREKISFTINPNAREPRALKAATKHFSADCARAARAFHRGLHGYAPTPLVQMKGLAGILGVTRIWVKDESPRFGLNAFKALGATYGADYALCERFGRPVSELAKTTLVTATDGNHGRAVAWAAARLGCRAVVYMPRGTVAARYENVVALGARAIVTECSYDETVVLASECAARNGWVLVQDTAGPGYEAVPRWIMKGYLTMMDEIIEQVSGEMPTHVFVQCGVGSFAAAVQAYLVEEFGDQRPVFTVVEPAGAASFFRSMTDSPRGEPLVVEGEIETIMAGLACGKPSTIAWEILRDFADAFVACPDWVAESGMRLLASPPGGDVPIVSGESGAVTAGLLAAVMERPDHRELAGALRLDRGSKILLISTEGDTDPVSYGKIVSTVIR